MAIHAVDPVNNDHESTGPLAATLALLAAASRFLAESLDYEHTIPLVLPLLVPQLGVYARVDLHEGDAVTTIAAYGDPATVTAWSIDVPLAVRGLHFGVLHLRGSGDSHLSRALAEEVALRAAVAIDHARTYAREHHVADTLQRALLPDRLPHSDLAAYDAAYRPGAEEAIVGGDWYDVFELGDGRIALSIGDVAGHGLRAAVVMGEVRHAFRAAALGPKTPSDVLERANRILMMRENPVMVTGAFGIYDPGDSTLTYATAGHPPPILATADDVLALPGEGLPMGIGEDLQTIDWTFTLPPGSQLVLYTDGMIEYGRDILGGERALLAAIEATARDAPPDPAQALQRRVFAERANTDDAATLTLTVPEARGDRFSFAFSALPLAVPVVRHALARYIRRMGVDDMQEFAVLTAVGEALANAVEHAYGGAPGVVRLDVERVDDELRASIEDQGRWRPAQKREERGRGFPLMRALSSGVEIKTDRNRTIVRLRFPLTAPVEAEAV